MTLIGILTIAWLVLSIAVELWRLIAPFAFFGSPLSSEPVSLGLKTGGMLLVLVWSLPYLKVPILWGLHRVFGQIPVIDSVVEWMSSAAGSATSAAGKAAVKVVPSVEKMSRPAVWELIQKVFSDGPGSEPVYMELLTAEKDGKPHVYMHGEKVTQTPAPATPPGPSVAPAPTAVSLPVPATGATA